MSELESQAAAVPEAPAETAPGRGRSRLLSILIPVVTFVAGGVVALAGEHLIAGREPAATRVLAFQDWRLTCPPEGDANARCTLTQEIVRQEGGTLLTLALNNAAADSRIVATVPHGVLIDPGLGFSAGQDALKVHPYETCLQQGCMAYVPLDAATLKSMQDNMTGQVAVVPAAGQQPVSIPFSLKGFKEGYAQLAAQQNRRGSMFGL